MGVRRFDARLMNFLSAYPDTFVGVHARFARHAIGGKVTLEPHQFEQNETVRG
jgi:hypothetical protein